MAAFGIDGYDAITEVRVDLYTGAYRVSGTIRTPFNRVAEILNQLPSDHLVIERATISEHDDESGTVGAPSAIVPLREILVLFAELSGETSSDMRIQKRAVRAQLAIPPLRITGLVHVPIGSRPADGLLNVQDRFVPMTEVTITSAAYSHLDRRASAVAVRHDRAHVLLVADDERPDQLLSHVLDERTAEAWLRSGEDAL